MRNVKGSIVLPPNTPSVLAKCVHVIAEDVSMMDAPSIKMAEQKLENLKLNPNEEINFSLPVPEAAAGHSLSLRVHIDLDGSNRITSGDLLTTAQYSIPNQGSAEGMRVPVQLI